MLHLAGEEQEGALLFGIFDRNVPTHRDGVTGLGLGLGGHLHHEASLDLQPLLGGESSLGLAQLWGKQGIEFRLICRDLILLGVGTLCSQGNHEHGAKQRAKPANGLSDHHEFSTKLGDWPSAWPEKSVRFPSSIHRPTM